MILVGKKKVIYIVLKLLILVRKFLAFNVSCENDDHRWDKEMMVIM